MGRPAIFLDRDGVINENLPDHVRRWEDFRFLPNAIEALRRLAALNLPIFVVTNQAEIGRGKVSRQSIEDIHRRMLKRIELAGAKITHVFLCPHEPSVGCPCRKPAPGMLLEAAARFDIDLSKSILVGDWHSDISAGQQSGCQTILVLTGRGPRALQEINAGQIGWPTAIASDVLDAVPIVGTLLATRQASVRSLALPVRSSPANSIVLAGTAAD